MSDPASVYERAAKEIYRRYMPLLHDDCVPGIAAILRREFPASSEQSENPGAPGPAPSAANRDSWYVPDLTRDWLQQNRPELVPHAEFINGQMQLAFEKGKQIGEGNAKQSVPGDEELRAAATRVAEWRGVFDRNSYEQFERIAEMFHKQTGMVAPGKDSPAARNDDLDERRRAFDEWATRTNDEIDGMLRRALAPERTNSMSEYKERPDAVGWYECRIADEGETNRFVRWWDGEKLREGSQSWVPYPPYCYTDFIGPLAPGDHVCRHCGKPATCYGTYEGHTGYSCDDCCGHGCEDGHCEMLRPRIAECGTALLSRKRGLRMSTDNLCKAHKDAAQTTDEAELASHRFVAECIVNPLKSAWPNQNVPAIATEVILRHVREHVKAAAPGDKRKRRTITLCGSTSFKRAYAEWNARLTLAGNVVFSVAMWSPSARIEPTAEQKIILDEVYKAKIDQSDEIFVLDVGGYIGSSTRSEIEHAERTGKAVRYLSQEFPDWTENDCTFAVSEPGDEELRTAAEAAREALEHSCKWAAKNSELWKHQTAVLAQLRAAFSPSPQPPA